MYPQLCNVEFEHFWWGQIGMTDDNLPRLGQLGPKALAVGGYNGRGIAPGTVYGRALAQHITGEIALEDIPVPVRPLKPAPFRRLKGLGIRAGAAALHAVAQRV
jgi:glycine/D-amino acid oxidase-like deaminating enzyme